MAKILKIILSATALLLIPLVAMQFTDELNWTVSDFAVIWTLLVGIGYGLTMLLDRAKNTTSRVIGLVIIVALLWIWAELAVGIFTNWGS